MKSDAILGGIVGSVTTLAAGYLYQTTKEINGAAQAMHDETNRVLDGGSNSSSAEVQRRLEDARRALERLDRPVARDAGSIDDIERGSCTLFVEIVSARSRLEHELRDSRDRTGTIPRTTAQLCAQKVGRLIPAAGLSQQEAVIAHRRADMIANICQQAASSPTAPLDGAQLCAGW